jgi:hypothetical protein
MTFQTNHDDEVRARDVAPTLLVLTALLMSSVYLLLAVARVSGAIDLLNEIAAVSFSDVSSRRDEPVGDGFGMALLAGPRSAIVFDCGQPPGRARAQLGLSQKDDLRDRSGAAPLALFHAVQGHRCAHLISQVRR